jgi:GTP-binding protein
VKSRTFVDTVVIEAAAGRGGDGCTSFRREKYVPRGGPDGGDGGRGGSVILRGDRNRQSLVHLFFTPHQRAESGGHGKGKQLHGRNGHDLVVPVPCGTEVRDAVSDRVLGDILDHDEDLRVARGGRGGLGNCHWKSSTHQAPTEHTDGREGEKRRLRLTLKTVADIGFVGFPNAGKSSLLTVLTGAHPKIAPYPFTTLHPHIGTMMLEDYSQVTLADIPGLIHGAHEGVGLGHAFLRHIERATGQLYVLDMAGVDGRDPADDFRDLREEIRLHAAELAERPFLVAANKMDLPGASARLEEFVKQTGLDPLPVSATTGMGLDRLKAELNALASDVRKAPRSPA